MSKLSFKRFRLIDLDPELFAAWQSITVRNATLHSPFFSPYFACAVARSVPQHCFVTVGFQNGQACGFFPFQFINRQLGRAERIGRHLSDYNGYIANVALDATQLREMLKSSGIHQYAFDHLPESQANLGIAAEFIREGTATRLAAGFDPYWQEREQIVPKFAKDTLRCLNKITKEVGSVRLQFHSSDPQDLQQLIDIKRRQYQLTNTVDSLSKVWQQECLVQLHAAQHADFKGVLSRLYAGEQLISAHFGISAHGVLHYWFPVYETRYASYSPGRLLFYFLAQQAAQNGITIIDSGMGMQRHKSDFSNHFYRLGVGALRRPTLRCLLLRTQDFIGYRLLTGMPSGAD